MIKKWDIVSSSDEARISQLCSEGWEPYAVTIEQEPLDESMPHYSRTYEDKRVYHVRKRTTK